MISVSPTMTVNQSRKQKTDVERVGRTRVDPHAASVSRRAQIESAIRAGKVKVRLWSDQEDRIYRIQLISSTGDAALDAAIRDDVLGSLMLHEFDTAQILAAKGFTARGAEDTTCQATEQVVRRVKYWGTDV